MTTGAETESAGVIGLGLVGSPVARLLRDTGAHVYVWSRSPKPVPNFVASPAELVQLTRRIQVFVNDGAGLVELVRQMEPKLGSHHIVINNSTVDPQSVVEAYEIVRAAGAGFLDAPFSGGPDAAGRGELVYYVGGDPSLLEKARDLLEISGRELVYVGRVGEATVVKLASNMIVANAIEAAAEAIELVESTGMDPARLGEVLENHGIGSPLLLETFAAMREQDFDPRFTLENMFGDLQNTLALAQAFGLDLPGLSTTTSVFYRAVQRGHGPSDVAAIARFTKENRKG